MDIDNLKQISIVPLSGVEGAMPAQPAGYMSADNGLGPCMVLLHGDNLLEVYGDHGQKLNTIEGPVANELTAALTDFGTLCDDLGVDIENLLAASGGALSGLAMEILDLISVMADLIVTLIPEMPHDMYDLLSTPEHGIGVESDGISLAV